MRTALVVIRAAALLACLSAGVRAFTGLADSPGPGDELPGGPGPAGEPSAATDAVAFHQVVPGLEDVVVRVPFPPSCTHVAPSMTALRGQLSVAGTRALGPGAELPRARRQGAVLYSPPLNFVGEEIVACTNANEPAAAEHRILILVRPQNDPPVVVPDRAAVESGRHVHIDVLRNDFDPDILATPACLIRPPYVPADAGASSSSSSSSNASASSASSFASPPLSTPIFFDEVGQGLGFRASPPPNCDSGDVRCLLGYAVGGVAAGDFDGDGHADLYLARESGSDSLWRANGDGSFADLTDASGLRTLTKPLHSSAAAWLDVDHDGDLDLLVSVLGPERLVLFLHDGIGHFVRGPRVIAETDLTTNRVGGVGLSVEDVDHDGFADVLLSLVEWNSAGPIANAVTSSVVVLRNRGAAATPTTASSSSSSSSSSSPSEGPSPFDIVDRWHIHRCDSVELEDFILRARVGDAVHRPRAPHEDWNVEPVGAPYPLEATFRSGATYQRPPFDPVLEEELRVSSSSSSSESMAEAAAKFVDPGRPRVPLTPNNPEHTLQGGRGTTCLGPMGGVPAAVDVTLAFDAARNADLYTFTVERASDNDHFTDVWLSESVSALNANARDHSHARPDVSSFHHPTAAALAAPPPQSDVHAAIWRWTDDEGETAQSAAPSNTMNGGSARRGSRAGGGIQHPLFEGGPYAGLGVDKSADVVSMDAEVGSDGRRGSGFPFVAPASAVRKGVTSGAMQPRGVGLVVVDDGLTNRDVVVPRSAHARPLVFREETPASVRAAQRWIRVQVLSEALCPDDAQARTQAAAASASATAAGVSTLQPAPSASGDSGASDAEGAASASYTDDADPSSGTASASANVAESAASNHAASAVGGRLRPCARDAWGAVVTVQMSADASTARSFVVADLSAGLGQGPASLLIGLPSVPASTASSGASNATEEAVFEVRVHWPATGAVRTFRAVPVRATLVVTAPASDDDASVPVADTWHRALESLPECTRPRVVATQGARHGLVRLGPGGRFVTYHADPGYVGPDSFAYTVHDGFGGRSAAFVELDVRVPAGLEAIAAAESGSGGDGGANRSGGAASTTPDSLLAGDSDSASGVTPSTTTTTTSSQPSASEGFAVSEALRRAIVAQSAPSLQLRQPTYDGQFNNLEHPSWGAAFTVLDRLAPAAYADGLEEPAGAGRPSPRLISNELFAQSTNVTDARDMSDLTMHFGQFLTHDIDFVTPLADYQSEANLAIEVPKGDPWFDKDGSGIAAMHFRRSGNKVGTGKDFGVPREQVNKITTFLDLSVVYGSAPERAMALREKRGGRLAVTHLPGLGDQLHLNQDHLPNLNLLGRRREQLMVSGDNRANVQPGLLSMHTLFVRLHNDNAAAVAREDPTASDDDVFERARALTRAQWQGLVWYDFLPALLGETVWSRIPPYAGYNASVNPTVVNEFATAAFRYGHSQIGFASVRLDADWCTHPQGHIFLRDGYFAPQRVLAEGGVDPILRGMLVHPAQEVDLLMVDDVRNLLFFSHTRGFDLAAFNVQRGRDHGLPDYSTIRAAVGLPRVTSFAEITRNQTVAEALARVYQGNVSNIDLFVGGLAEDHEEGSSLGPLFGRIISDQFRRLRDGDRFWFENAETSPFPTRIDEFRRFTLLDAIERASDVFGPGSRFRRTDFDRASKSAFFTFHTGLNHDTSECRAQPPATAGASA